MKNNYSHNIGSVSHGTMRREDLIPDFISALKSMRPFRRHHRSVVREIEHNMRTIEDYFDSEIAIYDLNERLFAALDNYAPPFFYFGSHPGNGADYGFWLSEEWEEQLADNGGIKVNDLSEVPIGFSGYVAQVSDHGNVTLYSFARGRSREVWSIC